MKHKKLTISFPKTLIESLTQCSLAHAELAQATLDALRDFWGITPVAAERVEQARSNVVLAEAYHKRFVQTNWGIK